MLNRTLARRSAAALMTVVMLLASIAVGVPMAGAQSWPTTPASVTLTRADGTVTASWPASAGATKYHITYSSDGRRSWSAAADSHTGTSITITGADNTKSYVVAVRAGNSSGWSGWRNSSAISPITPPPSTPSSIAVSRGDGTVTASGYAVSGAAKYHITYSSNGGYSWSAASGSHTGTSITITGADNSKTYIVAVRAGNSAGWSGWRNSAPSGPYTAPPPPPVTQPATPSAVTVTRGDGTLTASWPASDGAAEYHIVYSTDGKHSWSAASRNHTGTSITFDANNGGTYYVAVRAGNSAGWSGWRSSPISAATETPGIVVQDTDGNAITALSVPEGGEASYQVKLKSKPAGYVEICIGLSVRDRNDPSITFKGESDGTVALKVPFTPDNWDTAQTVTLVAAEDDDGVNGVRDVGIDTRDFVEYFAGTVGLVVTEIDND